MFERAHHRRIASVLNAFDAELLERVHCFFGGGTAIVLALNEYRESADIDFLCSDRDGYRELRQAISAPTLGALLRTPIKHVRDVRTERDKISTYLEVDDIPIKVEFVLEARIDIAGAIDASLGVPVLSRDDMYAEKILANADRGLDRSVMSRDLIDLAMMIQGWGPIPETAWNKTFDAYGPAVYEQFDKGLALLSKSEHLKKCMAAMSINPALSKVILDTLTEHRPRTVG
ncbi:nucleotidyl transferase AbiEii/AbiGii toxin family protein [Lysobacter sp. D1-1-M9]|uniref:nucleotidyl transferase AbiEii/AbiGii toxin family protein n=1 Tax=Novilysobacter longmucuonensis TaxID=3098603 RepID=UPI0031FF51F5